jgi:hypothetical protein
VQLWKVLPFLDADGNSDWDTTEIINLCPIAAPEMRAMVFFVSAQNIFELMSDMPIQWTQVTEMITIF